MSKKTKLIERLRGRPKDFTWDETVRLMRLCNFRLHHQTGSARMFVHQGNRTKVRLHEPHPQNTLHRYMVEQLLEGLKAAGEID